MTFTCSLDSICILEWGVFNSATCAIITYTSQYHFQLTFFVWIASFEASYSQCLFYSKSEIAAEDLRFSSFSLVAYCVFALFPPYQKRASKHVPFVLTSIKLVDSLLKLFFVCLLVAVGLIVLRDSGKLTSFWLGYTFILSGLAELSFKVEAIDWRLCWNRKKWNALCVKYWWEINVEFYILFEWK